MGTFFAYEFTLIFIGSIFVEKIFSWHGMGEWFVQSIQKNDVNSTVAIGMCGTLKIADHRKGHAGVTGKVLPEAQTSGRYALVATLHLFQLGTLRPEPVDTGL